MILYRTTLDQLLVWLKDAYIGDHAPSIDVLAGGSHLRKRPVLLWSVQFWLESFRLALKCSKRPKRIELPNVQKLLHFQGFRYIYSCSRNLGFDSLIDVCDVLLTQEDGFDLVFQQFQVVQNFGG